MSDRQGQINRRNWIKLMGVGTASVYFGGCQSLSAKAYASPMKLSRIEDIGPIDRTLGDITPREFSGDKPSLAHQILWKKQDYIKSIGGKLPEPTEHVPLVIIGGGISGLLAAYNLRAHSPVILEQASRFGGNSRGESWRGVDYTLATAYFGVPEKGGPIEKFLNDIGAGSIYRIHEGGDTLYVDGKKYDNIWADGAGPGSRKQFRKLAAHITDLKSEKNGQYIPDLPIEEEAHRAHIYELDNMSFKDYLQKVLGGPLHPHLEQYVEHYFWSAMAASYTETSAAAGLNFFGGDFGQVAACVGGNGAVAEKLMQNLMTTIPNENFRASSLVFDVRTTSDGAQVSYVDSSGTPRTIATKAVVMSCPKFVCGRLIDDMEPERRAAIHKVRYRSYMVANILLKQKIRDNFYDSYFFHETKKPLGDIQTAALAQKATDLLNGSHGRSELDHTVLTLFRGFPFDDVRDDILQPGAYEKYRAEFEEQIYNTFLPISGASKENVVEIRIARWGHPLPVADVGNVASGRTAQLAKPYNGRVFFIEQDNWTLPAFETAFSEAATWAPKIDAMLKS